MTTISLFSVIAEAQSPRNFGPSPYFQAHKDFKNGEWERIFKSSGWRTYAFIYNTPGTNLRAVAARIQRGGTVFVEAVFANQVCVRNNNCAKYEIFAGYDLKKLRRAIDTSDSGLIKQVTLHARTLSDFLLPTLRPDQECAINPLLEHDVNAEQWKKFTSWIRPAFKGRCGFVWNPVGERPGRPPEGADYVEGHGGAPIFPDGIPCIANPDGTTIPTHEIDDYLIRYAKCKAVFTWSPADNCRTSDGATTLDPRSRQCRVGSDWDDASRAIKAASKAPLPRQETEQEANSTRGCENIHSHNDGYKYAFVWKESDTKTNHKGDKVAIVLFPSKFGKFKKVEAWAKGKKYETLSFVYFYSHDTSKRAVWRTNSAPKDLPFHLVLRGTDSKGKVQCFKLENPRVRND